VAFRAEERIDSDDIPAKRRYGSTTRLLSYLSAAGCGISLLARLGDSCRWYRDRQDTGNAPIPNHRRSPESLHAGKPS
jgi:hypothetical protein